MKKTDDETLVSALRKLARDIRSDDGIAQAAIREAAERIHDQSMALRVIATWARCDGSSPSPRHKAMKEIADHCERSLVRKQVRTK